MDRYEVLNWLKAKGRKRIYLSHEEDMESEKDARGFALFLESYGITALVGADYRKIGMSAVDEAMRSCDTFIPYNPKPELGMG